jgi:cobalt-zinc-cadmium efflux system membrane fusion protein
MKRKSTAICLALMMGLALQAGGLAGCGDTDGRHVQGDRVEDREIGGHLGEEEHGEHDHEVIIEMSEAGMGELKIETLVAAAGTIERTVELPGEIVLNADRVVHIVPRVGGVVREVRTHLGDDVVEGEIMAVIESRELADATADYLASRERLAMARTVFAREEALWQKKISSEQEFLDAKRELMEARIASRAAEQKLLALGLSMDALERLPARTGTNLTRYEIRAPMAGTVIHKSIGLGEALEKDAEVYTVADLGNVWVDINVYQDDLPLVNVGHRVSIAVGDGGGPIESVIEYVGPILGEETRTALARVTLSNPDGRLRPGTFVTAVVCLDEMAAPVVVPREAVQTLNDRPVVFVWTGSGFETSSIMTGRSSGGAVEIVSGLGAGQRYAAAGAFHLKAMLVTGSMDGHAGHGH